MAMNPIIKFTTLFGLLAVELAVSLAESPALVHSLAIGCFAVSAFFVWKSFYGMRIKSTPTTAVAALQAAPQPPPGE